MFNEKVSKDIKDIIERMMDGVIERRLYTDPWDHEAEKTSKPFHFSLAPELVWKGSKFERSLVTTMGQIGWEQIARVIAEDYHGFAENGRVVTGESDSGRLAQINLILDQLEDSKNRKPDWDVELDEILNIHSDDKDTVRVIADLYVYNEETENSYYCEIKSPKPNSDQTKVSKEKLFKIKAMYPEDNHKVFFALPFNPYGLRENYSHSHPKRWFDMINDEAVLIGEEFWDLMGGEGTYKNLLKIFEEVGEEYRNLIEKEYFGLE